MIFILNILLAVIMLSMIGRLHRGHKRNEYLRDELLERAREVEALLEHNEEPKERAKLLVLRGGKEAS